MAKLFIKNKSSLVNQYKESPESYKKYLSSWQDHKNQFNLCVSRGLCIEPRQKFIFYKPGRVMGTFLFKEILSRHGDWITLQSNATEFNHWTMGVSDDEIKDSYTKCIIVRNPFCRVVSKYNSSCKVKSDNKRIKWRPADDCTFEEFVNDYYSNPELPPAEIHTIPFYKFFSSGKSTSGNPDYWGKIENISEDWNIIHNAFSLNKNKYQWPVYSGDVNGYRKYYNKTTRKIIEEYYKKDLEMFNYEF